MIYFWVLLLLFPQQSTVHCATLIEPLSHKGFKTQLGREAFKPDQYAVPAKSRNQKPVVTRERHVLSKREISKNKSQHELADVSLEHTANKKLGLEYSLKRSGAELKRLQPLAGIQRVLKLPDMKIKKVQSNAKKQIVLQERFGKSSIVLDHKIKQNFPGAVKRKALQIKTDLPLKKPLVSLEQSIESDVMSVQKIAQEVKLPADGFRVRGKLPNVDVVLGNKSLLLEGFSETKQLGQESGVLEHRNQAICDKYIGEKKQFANPESFAKALIVERNLTDYASQKASQGFLRDTFSEQVDRYDRAIQYVTKRYGVDVKKIIQQLAPSPVPVEKKRFTVTQKKIIQSQAENRLKQEVAQAKQLVEREIRKIDKLKTEAAQYKKLVSAYHEASERVQDLAFQISEKEFVSVTFEVKDAYKKAIDKLREATSVLARYQIDARNKFFSVENSYKQVMDTITQEHGLLDVKYIDEVGIGRVDAHFAQLTALYNDCVQQRMEFQQLQNLVEKVSSDRAVATHNSFIKALNSSVSSGSSQSAKPALWLKELIKKLRKYIIRKVKPASVSCIEHSYELGKFGSQISELTNKVYGIGRTVDGFSAATKDEEISMVEDWIKSVFTDIQALQQDVVRARDSIANVGYTVCVISVIRMNALLNDIGQLFQALVSIEKRMLALDTTFFLQKSSKNTK